MRILVIEPSRDFGNLLKQNFKSKQFDVDLAYCAQEALRLADKKRPDLAILELNLPSHNGLEFLYELKSHWDWQDMPVIVYSHLTPEETKIDKKLQTRLGIREFLYKSQVSLEKLSDCVQELVLEPSI